MAADTESKPESPDSLIKATRILDQSSPESLPDTLKNLWRLLSSSPVDKFHSAEELILRWILKNMNGKSAPAEQFRRYPMAWVVMACVLTRIPLSTLARSLIDRRFVSILEQTLKEISNPQDEEDEASSDVEMADGTSSPKADSKKRKRSPELQFDLLMLRKAGGCLRTADSLFGALEKLLARLKDVPVDAPLNVRMGAEHVKGMFFSPAKEIFEILRPMLSICGNALNEQESEPAENRPSWINVLSDLWDLHRQSGNDAVDVALSLYPTGCVILAKIDRSKDLVVDARVKASWRQSLRRFFVKNMILPARAAFLNNKDVGIIQEAVNMTSSLPTASCPVLFSLAVSPSGSTDDASGRKDRQDWSQKAFEIVEEAMRTAEPTRRNEAMKIVLDTALQNNASISLDSLRQVCRQYTTDSGSIDLSLVPRVADIDVDAFMISTEGQSLLDDVIAQITSLGDAELNVSTETDLVKFVVSLAEGSAKARNVPWFIRKWTEVLSESLAKDGDFTTVKGIWTSVRVVDAVANLLQPSINISQLRALIEWLGTSGDSFKKGSLLVVLDAMTQGLTDEEYVDSAGTRLFDLASDVKLKHLEGVMKARWWRIVERTISQSELGVIGTLWEKVESDLKKALKKEDLADPAAIAAFRCCTAFWLANYPKGPLESETSAMAWTFLKRLQKADQKAAAADDSTLAFYDARRLVDLAASSDFSGDFLAGLLACLDKADPSSYSVQSLLLNEASLGNYKYLNALVSHAIGTLAREGGDKSKRTKRQVNSAIHILLDLPSETLSREQREKVVPSLLRLVDFQEGMDMKSTTSLMSLMIKVMKRPTYYEDIKFADLVALGQKIQHGIKSQWSSILSTDNAYKFLKLFETLALITLKQMTSSWEERDRVYLSEASRIVLDWPAKPSSDETHRYILLRALVSALQSSKVKQQAQAVVDPTQLMEKLSSMLANALVSSDLNSLYEKTGTVIVVGQETPLSPSLTHIFIEQLDILDAAAIRASLLPSKEKLEHVSDELCSRGFKSGWRLKELLFKSFGGDVKEALYTSDDVAVWRPHTHNSVPRPLLAGQNDITRYVNVVLMHTDDEARASYAGAICQNLREGHDITGDIIAIHQLLQADGKSSLGLFAGLVNWSQVQHELTERLPKSRNWAEFSVIAKTAEFVLEKKPMKQWNIENALRAVAVICSNGPTMIKESQASDKAYPWLCGLVEVIIKRHRHRLEGHFHLLTTTLQALLRLLIIPWPTATLSSLPANTSTSPAPPDQEAQAARFSRLLTLICEPSVASVTRGQNPGGALDSAPEAAKKSAAQHMFLVLVTFIKLQLDRPVARGVRAALDPGVYSVLDITTAEGRRMINEAVDASGRAIFRDMYKRYVRFGKWNGV
ncbi:Urb2/Npa2 family protein [Diaporthe helianthi]|uniref:Urb2/Npa2 family protein n=1 Tax=Diaporthe helianthi TaxID=158607 RepID=A0A2P5IBZ7_DIAHE|nr:Urb2/Npa2 family protein [Diaporthe helianthi]